MRQFRQIGSLARALGAAAAVFAGILTGADMAAAQEPLKISFVSGNAIYWDIDTAIEKGFFRDEGFAPETIVFQSSPQSIQLLIAGEVHLSGAQPEVLLLAIKNGAKGFSVISAPADRADWLLLGRSDIKRLADVRGQFFGTGGLQVGENWWTWRLLATVGIAPKDISVVQVGTSALKFAALQKGAIAFTVLFQPTAQQAVSLGMNTLYRFADGEAFPPILYSVGDAWAKDNDRGRRLSGALARAHRWLYDPANRDEALAILRKYTKREPELLAPIYDLYFGAGGLYSRDGAVDTASMNRVVGLMSEFGALPPGVTLAASQYLLPTQYGGLAR
jgi:ABC-type nitrate/sulfonate/bicarbonate transport system substrate-binding protein